MEILREYLERMPQKKFKQKKPDNPYAQRLRETIEEQLALGLFDDWYKPVRRNYWKEE